MRRPTFSGSRRPDAPEATAKSSLGNDPWKKNQFMPGCAETTVQGFEHSFPEGCGGAAQGARLLVPGVKMTCLHR